MTVYEKDGDADALLAQDRSIASGRTMEEIAAGRGRSPKPFMAKRAGKAKRFSADAVWQSNRDDGEKKKPSPPLRAQSLRMQSLNPQGKQWRYRTLCRRSSAAWSTAAAWREGGRTRSSSTATACSFASKAEGRPCARARGSTGQTKFRPIANLAAALPDGIIDGEIVALDHNGAPDFAALQAALSEGKAEDLVFFAFDLLYSEGEGSSRPPAVEAQGAPRTCHPQKARTDRVIRYVDHFVSSGDAVLRSACRMSLEGHRLKRVSMPPITPAVATAGPNQMPGRT